MGRFLGQVVEVAKCSLITVMRIFRQMRSYK